MEEKPGMDAILLRRFFYGDCNEVESEFVLEWLSNPENKLLASQYMRTIWDDKPVMPPTGNDPDISYLLRKTRERIDNMKENRAGANSRKGRWDLIRKAAVWTGLLFTVSAALYLATPWFGIQDSFAGNDVEVKTSSGQMILKILPDGTKVWLNAQSSLTYPPSFSGKPAREVTLKGEGLFEVTKNGRQPFVVVTAGVNILVLGTTFNLKAYDGDPTIETTLLQGRVIIEKNKGNAGERVELKPNQKAVFSHSTESITLVDVQGTNRSAWNSGSLVFEDDKLYDVIKSLERWYGVTIHIQDKSNMGCRLTARIDVESLVETMEILKSLTGIAYAIKGNDVYINGRICEL